MEWTKWVTWNRNRNNDLRSLFHQLSINDLVISYSNGKVTYQIPYQKWNLHIEPHNSLKTVQEGKKWDRGKKRLGTCNSTKNIVNSFGCCNGMHNNPKVTNWSIQTIFKCQSLLRLNLIWISFPSHLFLKGQNSRSKNILVRFAVCQNKEIVGILYGT